MVNDAAGRFADVVETHSGVVFFLGDRAYKLKKPVEFGFLDFRRREVREAICHREVELNRRLAPDVYLGVIDVRDAAGAALDHLIVMRRLPPGRSLAALVRAGAPVDDDVRQVARVMAAFHARAASSPAIDAASGPEVLEARWEANAREMAPFAGDVLDPEVLEAVTPMARRYLAGRAPLFATRVAAGRARDGHGDLQAEDIFCLEDGPRVLDCIEFDDRLRWGDTVGDVAFLAMDLERLGRPDLASSLVGWYQEFSGDTWPASLLHHHIAYRAEVRAKVACLRWVQGDEASADAARTLLAMTRAHLDGGRVRLVIVGGLPATGKSTLSAGLGRALNAVVIRSDEVRKRLAGLDTATPAPAPVGEGLYAEAPTAATYAGLLAGARRLLAQGESVVLDASWHDPVWRDEARALAAEAFADLDELQCVAPRAVLEHRLLTRSALGHDPSDATVAVVQAMANTNTPWPTAMVIDAEPPADQVLEHALARLQGRHEAPGGGWPGASCGL